MKKIKLNKEQKEILTNVIESILALAIIAILFYAIKTINSLFYTI